VSKDQKEAYDGILPALIDDYRAAWATLRERDAELARVKSEEMRCAYCGGKLRRAAEREGEGKC
jgi:uncharacterized protein with PIN domain